MYFFARWQAAELKSNFSAGWVMWKPLKPTTERDRFSRFIRHDNHSVKDLDVEQAPEYIEGGGSLWPVL